MLKLVNSINFGFRNVSEKRAALKRHRYYDTRPDLFQKYSVIKKKIDFKNADLTFPINIPLKFKYVYRPRPQLVKKILPNDHLNFETLTGNEILLYLNEASNLRIHELISALIQVQKRDKDRKLNLREHPWVINSVNEAMTRLNDFKKEEFMKFLYALQQLNYGDEELWAKLRQRTKVMLARLEAKYFAQTYEIYLENNAQRATPEFIQELSLLMPIHLKQMNALAIAKTFELTYERNLMTEYLFEDHLHHLFWKRTKWFISENAFSQMLRLFRLANYEEDEFLWPDIYKLLSEEVSKIAYDQVRPIYDELVLVQKAFPSHAQYNLDDIIQRLNERVTWEETLGKDARELTLVDIVKNDLLFYKEKMKLRSVS